MEISVMTDKEQEKRLIAVLAQVVLETGEEEPREESRRILPRVDHIE